MRVSEFSQDALNKQYAAFPPANEVKPNHDDIHAFEGRERAGERREPERGQN